jgi:hypothetical protein
MIYILKGILKNGKPSKEKWCLFDDDYQVAFFFKEEDDHKMIEKIAEEYCLEFQAREISLNPEKKIIEILEKKHDFIVFEVLTENSTQMNFITQKVKNLLY